MTSRRNVNLNKELANDWVGRVRKWKRQWVPVDDKPPPGKKPCVLLKWVQTDARAQPGPSRHPHIVPVKDLSLVPGARVGPAPDAAETAGALVADPTAAPPLLDPSMQQVATPSAAAAAADVALPPSAFTDAAAAPAAPSADAQAPAAAATASELAAAGLSPSELPLDAAAAATAAAAAGVVGMPHPSSLAATASGLSLGVGGLGQASSSQQLLMAGLGGAPSMPAASDYTAGTDSEALGRLPHGGAAVSDYTGGIDSMDVDDGLGGAMSQGTASRPHAAGDADMDEEDELDDGLGDEDDEDQEDDDEDDEEDDDEDQQQDDDGLEDDGLERGVVAVGVDDDDDNDDEDDDGDDEDVEDDMPG